MEKVVIKHPGDKKITIEIDRDNEDILIRQGRHHYLSIVGTGYDNLVNAIDSLIEDFTDDFSDDEEEICGGVVPDFE